MKKMFTLLFAVVLFTAANAQYNQRDNRNNGNDRQKDQRVNQQHDQRDDNNGYAHGKKDNWNNNGFDKDGRYNNNNNLRMQMARINREYDYKIQNVKHNRYLNRFEKQRQIRFLQEQRKREIHMMTARNNRNGQNGGGYNSHPRY